MTSFVTCVLVVVSGVADDVLEVGKGLKINGMLDKTKPQQVYQVKLHEGGTYVIDMVSPNPKALDPFLRLLDVAGNKVAEDDDSGGGQNARITFAARTPGTYQIVATSNGAGVGPFTVAIVRYDSRQADALQAALPANLKRELAETAKLNIRAVQLYRKGRYAEAGPLFEKARTSRRKILGDDHPDTVASFNNVGLNRVAQGRYAEARPCFEEALATRRRILGEKHPDTAVSYNNLAHNLICQGEYAAAVPFCQKALATYRNIFGEEHPAVALSYNNLAHSLMCQRKYVQAEAVLEKVVAINRKLLGEDHPHTILSYNNLAADLYAQDKYAEAVPLLERSLASSRKIRGEEHPETAMCYANLAGSLNAQGKYVAAFPLYKRALAMRRKLLGDEHADTARSWTDLGLSLHSQGKYAEAEKALSAASRIHGIARLRSAQTGLERASFSVKESPASFLTACLARNGKTILAWQALESSLARGLLERITFGPSLAQLMTADQGRRQRDLLARLEQLDAEILRSLTRTKKDEKATEQIETMVAQRRQAGEELAKLEAALAARQVYDVNRIQSRIPADAAIVAWVDVKGQPKARDPNGEHWACVLRRTGPPAWLKLPGSGSEGQWTKDDHEAPARFGQALSSASDATRHTLEALRAQLIAQRLRPMEPILAATKHLPPVTHLLVVPAGWMAGIPMDALTDRYTVSYVPSGTMFARLGEKAAHASESQLLALGDPVFPSIEQRDARLRAVRGRNYPPLPGTRAEVAGIARLFPQSRTLLQSDASEQQLYTMVKKGELKKYRFLHFATHAEVDSGIAFNSALILSQDHLPEPADALLPDAVLDGRLTAEEISKWTREGEPLLDADLVVLSACQSGLGREAGGEGYLGFSQALFLAGARSLVVSLWKVDDSATALLMVRFYENLLGRRAGLKAPMPKAEALAEAKRWLRHLTAKEAETLAKNLPSAERIGPPAAGHGRRQHPAGPMNIPITGPPSS